MMMKTRTGAVMMEFIIVLPIFMLFISFAFFAGELSLHGIHLAGMGDRILAYDGISEDQFKRYSNIASGENAEGAKYVKEKEFSGGTQSASLYQSFTYPGKDKDSYIGKIETALESVVNGTGATNIMVRAGLYKDDYLMSPLTRGIMAFWVTQKHDVEKDELGSEYAISQLYRSSSGRLQGMTGKAFQAASDPAYGYYTVINKERNEPPKLLEVIPRDDSLKSLTEASSF